MKNKYCNSLTSYSRFETREVMVGSLGIGGNNPIRVQSMTTTDTMDTAATVAQSIRLIEAGCELVRITAPSIKEAENLKAIQDEIRAAGYNTPLVADIHFTPNAAEVAARIVDKVRINPGNYADKKKFEAIEYSDESYAAELERIHERFSPLVHICKEEGTAMRIGTNHGSLSDRIMSRYGDTPLGMVESALEFARICEDHGYHDIIFSMKSSNPQVMVQAYRLLVNRMMAAGQNNPLHLGVTEAGEGEDGRIKSAVGIGTLLEDGLGDTIRVSLTEEPELEMPVAKALTERYDGKSSEVENGDRNALPYSPFEYKKRVTRKVLNIGGENAPVVIANYSLKKEVTQPDFAPIGYQYNSATDKWNIGDMACDYVFIDGNSIDFELPGSLGVIQNHSVWEQEKERHYPLINAKEYAKGCSMHASLNFIYCSMPDFSDELIKKLQTDSTAVLLIDTSNEHGAAEQRQLVTNLMIVDCPVPIVIGRAYAGLTESQFQLYSATDMGALLIDGIGDGIFIAAEHCGSDQLINQTAFGILQATRTRISKTEYISCPSCGRTLFDLQETTAKIRAVTNHLKGLKIGIMGCIVNGPGEMADADYGYVGTGPGKITLYKQQEVVQRNIPEAEAVEALINLIKQHGDWVEP